MAFRIPSSYADAIKKIKTNFKEQDEKQLKENQLTHVDQANLLTYEEGITNAMIYPYSNGKIEAKNTLHKNNETSILQI